jgi:magnesium transporter
MLTNYTLCQQENQQWIDLENPSEQEILDLGSQFNIDAIYLQDVMQPEHLPKWEYADEDEQYFFIARYADPIAPKAADNIHAMTRKLAVFLRPGVLITIHRGHIPFLDDIRQKCVEPASRYKTTEQLLCRMLKEVYRSYEQMVVTASRELEYYESKILQNHQLPPFLKGLFLVRRRSSVTRKVLLLSKTLMDALRGMDINPSQIQDARDMFVRVETLSEDLYERSASLISMHLALADQRANQVMKVLTIFSAFFLPITFIAGVYGMNFEFMPETQTHYGYFISLGAMALVSIGIYSWFKRAGWM